jgi:anaerobic selenocysteine-containing dehydrogenase
VPARSGVETVKTFCRFCHAFCGMEADVVDGRIVALRGDPEHAVSQGYTCPKGRAELERLTHPDRLRSAAKRVDGELVALPTEQALDEIAARLNEIIDQHGPHSVAVYVGGGGHRTAAGGPWFSRRFLDGIGSRSMYTAFTIDSPSLPVAMTRLFGAPLPVQMLDLAHADVAMFVGTNPLVSHFMTMPQPDPIRRLRAAKRRGLYVIVVDPRRTETAQHADLHLQVRPGEDATLFAGMIKLVIEEGLYDHDYVAAHASGLDELGAAVAPFDLAHVERRTGVPAALVREAATRFATAARGGAQTGTGVHMARRQVLSTQLVMVLNALCGRYDRRGGLTHHDGAIGIALPPLDRPLKMPRYQGPTSRIRNIGGSFNVVGFFEEMPANTLTDEILTPGEGQIRALIVYGGNPALVFADARSTEAALASLDLLVVADLFETATAEHAHYLLAVRHPFERTDVSRLADAWYPLPFSQYTAPVVEPPPGVIEDWQVFWGLARRMEAKIDLPGIEPDHDPTTDDVLDALHRYSRIPLDDVRRHPGGHVWGPADPVVDGVIPHMISHDDGRMALGDPAALAELAELRDEVVPAGGGDEPGETFAFRLITYRMREVYCSQGQNLPSVAAKRPHNPVLMHPDAMRRLGLSDGDQVEVDSGFGRVVGVVEASRDVAPDVVALAFGWGGRHSGGVNVQHLIPDDVRFDPDTGLAQQSAVPVNVTPVPMNREVVTT